MGREEGSVMPPLSLPLPMISADGGYVGGCAFVTVSPIGIPLKRLPPFLRRMNFKWEGFVMLRKY